jgi:hypothetical protein
MPINGKGFVIAQVADKKRGVLHIGGFKKGTVQVGNFFKQGFYIFIAASYVCGPAPGKRGC